MEFLSATRNLPTGIYGIKTRRKWQYYEQRTNRSKYTSKYATRNMLLFADFPHFSTIIISLSFCSFLCWVWQTFPPVVFLPMSWGKKRHLQQTISIFIKDWSRSGAPKITLGNLPYPINMWAAQPKTNFSTVVTHSGVIIPCGRRHTSPPSFSWGQVGVKDNGVLTCGSCSCVGCEFRNPSFHEVW